jgi:prepilin-type N-terminal cleavage/methylation domain-containing protein
MADLDMDLLGPRIARRERKKFQMRGAQITRSGGVLNIRRQPNCSCRVPGSSQILFPGQPTPQVDFLCSRHGFTLLEVLVSLSIVAIAVTVVFQLFSAGLRAIAASEDYAAAVVKAEAKMREVLDSDDLPETSWSEATPDGYRMDLSVTDVLKEKTKNLQVRLMEVNLTTSWFKGTKVKMVALRTMKMVNKLAPAGAAANAAAGKATPGATAPARATPGGTGPR